MKKVIESAEIDDCDVDDSDHDFLDGVQLYVEKQFFFHCPSIDCSTYQLKIISSLATATNISMHRKIRLTYHRSRLERGVRPERPELICRKVS